MTLVTGPMMWRVTSGCLGARFAGGLSARRSGGSGIPRIGTAARIHNSTLNVAHSKDDPDVATEDECAAYYDNASHYDVLWGTDNIHIGYYPHLVRKGELPLNFQQAAVAVTDRMCMLGDINHSSRVLDLGCGKGIACAQIAENTGAECVGVDLSPGNIKRANAMADSRPDLRLSFTTASFSELPDKLRRGYFSHVIAQESFSHAHAILPTIFEQVKAALAPSGVAVINDYCGADIVVSETTKRNVHDRLGFGELLGHIAWRRTAESTGLEILHYENLDRHMAHGYSQLAELASQHDFCSADGTPLAEGYINSSKAAANREIGLNLAVLRVL